MNVAKGSLREHLRAARAALDANIRASETAGAVSALRDLLAQRGHPPVASYVAVRGELDLSALHADCWSHGRPVWLPRVVGYALTWHPVRASIQLVPGSYRIPEPDPLQVPDAALPRDTVLLVPGVGFAADGFRLGQGAGFYDRVLPGFPGLSIGIGFTCQRHDGLPREPHDHPLRAVLLGSSWILAPPGSAAG